MIVNYINQNGLHREDGPAVIHKNEYEWYLYNRLHRINAPAFIKQNEYLYVVNGETHRIGDPASIIFDEDDIIQTLDYKICGKSHNFDKVASSDCLRRIYCLYGKITKIHLNGLQLMQSEKYLNGILHQDFYPALIGDHSDEFYINGKLHREDGPAIISENAVEWYINGLLHRIDGPAIIRKDGTEEYWIHGERIK